jgi:hypothetical protein
LLLLVQPVVQAAVSPAAGRLSDRVPARVVASAGMMLTVIGLVALLGPLSAATSLGYVGACLGILGAGFGLFSSPNTNAVMSAVESRRFGLAAATLGTMRLTGQMLSMGIAMVLLSIFVGQAVISPAHHQTLLIAIRTALGVFALLCVGGTLASLARGGSAGG